MRMNWTFEELKKILEGGAAPPDPEVDEAQKYGEELFCFMSGQRPGSNGSGKGGVNGRL